MQYYKPWELLPGLEQKIKLQVEEAEAIVAEEAAAFSKQEQEQSPEDTKNAADIDETMELRPSNTVGSEANTVQPSDAPLDNTTNHDPSSIPADPPEPLQVFEAGKDIGDDNGEVVLEADEDTVIY